MTSVGGVALAFISPNAMATATTSKASTAGAHSPSAAVDLFADRVETLGVGRYPATFAGATLEPTVVTVVYAVAASDAKLMRAVRALDRHGYPPVTGALFPAVGVPSRLLGQVRTYPEPIGPGARLPQYVVAIGIIEGGAPDANLTASRCWATQIDHIVFITGKSLLTTS